MIAGKMPPSRLPWLGISLRKPKSIAEIYSGERGGLTTRSYRVYFKKKTLRVVTRATAEGKLEQYTVSVE